MNKLTLWTLQPLSWYAQLLTNKVIYADTTLVKQNELYDEAFRRSYAWMSQQMIHRGIKPSVQTQELPLWAWYQYTNADKKRPDLRSSGFFAKGTKAVRIEFVKNSHDVLLSDFDLWHYVLNGWNITDNESEDEQFDTLLNAHAVSFGDIASYPTHIRQQMEASWNKIFDMNYASPYSSLPFEQKSIQATFWELTVDDIIKVDSFVAR